MNSIQKNESVNVAVGCVMSGRGLGTPDLLGIDSLLQIAFGL
jgi:hypothetical protein